MAIGVILSSSCAKTGAAHTQAAARAAAETSVERMTMAVLLPPEDSRTAPGLARCNRSLGSPTIL